MKNKKALHVQFKTLDQLKHELLSLHKNKKTYIQPKDVILFESLNGFRNFMTLQKLEILTLIASEKPKSVYELAKMVNRSIAPVQKDCTLLASFGFIILEKEKVGRGNLVPRLKFDFNRIIVEVPQYPYELSFRSAA